MGREMPGGPSLSAKEKTAARMLGGERVVVVQDLTVERSVVRNF